MQDSSLISCLWHSKDTLMCLTPYVYQPTWVYAFICTMMILSSIGLPIPEEATLVSVGILAFMGRHPDLYPPTLAGDRPVDPQTAAIISFFAVFSADFLVYGMGRMFGRRIFEWKPVRSVLSEENRTRIEEWTQKYGAYACGIFRFTPGLRFPGHLACGMLRFPAWKFGLIDGTAALISVPTQILLLAHYGAPILKFLGQFKKILFLLLLIVGIYLLVKKLRTKKTA